MESVGIESESLTMEDYFLTTEKYQKMENPIKIGKDLFYMVIKLKQAGSITQAKAWSMVSGR